jgi:hypothetical protein
VCAPDDGWRYYPKHVEQFSRNKLCNVAAHWKYITRNVLTMRGPLNVKKVGVEFSAAAQERVIPGLW